MSGFNLDLDVIGVYRIKNIRNGKVYIGSTTDQNGVNGRWRYHQYSLNHNKHHSFHLQNAWNKYGSESFNFVMLKTIFLDKNNGGNHVRRI